MITPRSQHNSNNHSNWFLAVADRPARIEAGEPALSVSYRSMRAELPASPATRLDDSHLLGRLVRVSADKRGRRVDQLVEGVGDNRPDVRQVSACGPEELSGPVSCRVLGSRL